MSRLGALLDPWLALDGADAAPGACGGLVLSVLPDVLVNLHEDGACGQLHFLSAVGQVGGEDLLVDAVVEPAGLRGTRRLLVAEATGLVAAVRTVDALGLDTCAFAAELGAHVAFARSLSAALAPTTPPAEPGLPQPWHGASHWLECAPGP